MASSKSTDREAREARERLRRFTARQAVHENRIARRKRDNLLAVGAIIVVASLATVAQIFYFNGGPGTPTPAPSASESAAPPVGQNVGNVPDPGFGEYEVYTGSMTLNDTVTLDFSLDTSLAPQAGSSILADSTTGYYVGKTCHRLVQTEGASLLQCGSIDGAGSPDPEYSYGPIENAPVDGIYPAGTIAMARGSNDAYSNGRQFFIVLAETRLPGDSVGGYSVVGQVTSGLDELIAQVASAGIAGGLTDGAPVVPTTITAFTIQ